MAPEQISNLKLGDPLMGPHITARRNRGFESLPIRHSLIIRYLQGQKAKRLVKLLFHVEFHDIRTKRDPNSDLG
jgi:hypothetical protein